MLTTLMFTLLAQLPSAEPTGDAFSWLLQSGQWVIAQFQAKNFLPACAMLVMMAVWAAKKFLGDKLKTEHMALLAAGLSLLSSLAMELIGMKTGSGGFDIFRALANGLMVGAGASGFWSLVGKKLFPNASPPADPPAGA